MYYVNALITAKTFVLYCKRLSVSLFSVCKDKKLYNTKQTFIEKSFKLLGPGPKTKFRGLTPALSFGA